MARVHGCFAALCTAATALSGCAGGLESAARGRWIEVRRANASVLSDLDRADAVAVALEIERFWSALGQITGLQRTGPGVPVRIYAFRQTESYRSFAPEGTLGFYAQPFDRGFIGIDCRGNWRQAIFHELVHRYLRGSGRRYPIWYEEGLAEFLSTARIGYDRVEIGRPPERPGLAALRRMGHGEVPVAVRLRILEPQGEGDLHYGLYWAMVSSLTLGHLRGDLPDRRPQLAEYLALADRGAQGNEALWRALGRSERQLVEDAVDYVTAGQFARVSLELTDSVERPPVPRAEAAAPTEAEVLAALAELSLAIEKREQASRLFARVEASGAQVPAALRWRASQLAEHRDFAGAEALLQRALKSSEVDAQTWVALGDLRLAQAAASLGRRAELVEKARGHYRRALEIEPRAASAYAGLGECSLLAGDDPKPALEALERARALVPTNPRIELGLGKVHARMGEPLTAREHFRSVLRAVKQGPLSDQARQAIAELFPGDAGR